MGTKFAWSYDDEDYIGSYEDPQTAFDEAVDAVNAEDRPEVIYVAEIIDTKERLMKGYRLAMANSVIDTLESMLDDFIPSDYQIIEMNLKKFPETAEDCSINTRIRTAKIALGEALIKLVLSRCTLNRFAVTNPVKWKCQGGR